MSFFSAMLVKDRRDFDFLSRISLVRSMMALTLSGIGKIRDGRPIALSVFLERTLI